MSSRINILDAGTVAKIAAGEVVERPASVVKELVENSLDAGASRIEVEIKGGGITLISVTDNGCGMSAEDLSMACRRHATSKLRQIEDLSALGTLGFRGEALYSIAAVSRLRITTRPSEAAHGFSLSIEQGVHGPIQEEGCPPGTRVVVMDLFYNTPARRKFLKPTNVEAMQVMSTLTAQALSHPETSFTLVNNGKRVFFTPGNGDLLEAFASLFGIAMARGMLPLGNDGEDLWGYVCRPSSAKGSRRCQVFTVNSRVVSSTGLRWALEEGYRGKIQKGHYPAAVINLQVDPSMVDVNVHPTKAQVKFKNESEIKKMLLTRVRNVLESSMTVPAMTSSFPRMSSSQGQATANPGVIRQSEWLMRESDRSSDSWRPLWEPCPDGEPPSLGLKSIGQIKGSYILAEGPDGLYIIDQHAAHERVLFEKISSSEPGSPQPLLVPVAVDLDPEHVEILHECLETLARIGFEAEDFGTGTILIRSVPAALGPQIGSLDVREIIRDVIAEYAASKARPAGSIPEHRMAMAACKSAVKAGKDLTPTEISGLVEDICRLPQPFTCPHGRPTMFKITWEELKRRFGRD